VAGAIETYRGVVYPWQCDHVGHMNVMHYVGKFDEATWVLFDRIGLTRAFLTGNRRGMAAVDQRIAYRRELRAGDVVAVESTLLEVREKALRFAHRMTIPAVAEVAAVTMLTAVHLDTERRRAAVLPETIRAQAQAFVGEAELPWESTP
jgi:acyl-CoA thioester hydrolase